MSDFELYVRIGAFALSVAFVLGGLGAIERLGRRR
jgi:hypothetical protein